MEKLSIEEKAARYDEALRVLHKYDDANIMFSQSLKEEMFPELKESEDEGVRNKLIEFFKGYSPDKEWWGNITQEDILAWLERQGEYINFRKMAKVGDRITKSEDGVLVNLSQFERMAKPKKELKKTENEIEIPFGAKDSELQEVTYYIPKGFHAEIDNDKVVIKKGEKPITWSEEDERIYNLLYEEYKNLAYYSHSRNQARDIPGEILGWLKSLKERVQPT